MIDEVVWRALLYDFYGQLLTDKQIEVMEMHYEEDLSLSEISQQLGISRQGVYDTVRRGEKALEEYEAKLGLVDKFLKQKELLRTIQTSLSKMLHYSNIDDAKNEMTKLMESIDYLL